MNVTIQKADSPNAITRERRYASKGRAAISLAIARENASTWCVYWNITRGAGWRSKAWCATRKGETAEAEALAFAEGKWPDLLAWLEKVEPVDGGGAASAFSAQVASMSR